MLQILQRLQQHEDTDEAELADTASDAGEDHALGLSDQMQQKLSMVVCVRMEQVPYKAHLLPDTWAETQANKLDLV